jgi:hypothetical protein
LSTPAFENCWIEPLRSIITGAPLRLAMRA